MRWTPGGASRNLEDRRGSSGGGFNGGFGGGARLGVGGTLILLILSVVFRQDFFALVEGHSVGGPIATAPAAPPAQSPQESRQVQFVSFVLDDAQNSWRRTLGALGAPYRDAKLVLFRNATRTGCGVGQTASGPFYCPADEKVYIDLSFYDELKRFGAAGDFAKAYVIAHELGHHVQHILGVDQQFRRAQQANPSLANALSVRFELQADCLAGVWGNSTAQRDLLDQADIDQGLAAAQAVGDDRIQRMTTGRVDVDGFTHGSSAQRATWFRRGLASGKVADCDTFARTAQAVGP
jgi:predicted metalloprotease